MSERVSGVVIKWMEDRGFGFLERDDGGDDIFCHIRAVENCQDNGLEIGQRVSFDVLTERDGRTKATLVRVED
jgi:cold shock protein